MKKMMMLLVVLAFSVLGLAGPAHAGDDQPSADNKKVEFCHYAGSNENGGSGNYVKIETSVAAFYNAGHIDHVNDIWEAFSYVTKGGDTVNVPARGNTALLAFENCDEPEEDTPVTKPDVTFADPCGTENDVFAVAPGEGYTVSGTTTDGVKQTINVTLDEGFVWVGGTKEALSFERPVFTNVDCGLPETGGSATYNTTGGYLALAGAAAGLLLLLRRRTA